MVAVAGLSLGPAWFHSSSPAPFLQFNLGSTGEVYVLKTKSVCRFEAQF